MTYYYLTEHNIELVSRRTGIHMEDLRKWLALVPAGSIAVIPVVDW